jgi:uncharacterized protein YjbI with pentapeptide repeats
MLEASIDGCDFTAAIMREARLLQTKVFDCTFADVELEGANLYHCAFRCCRLPGIHAAGSKWGTAILQNCEFRRADLTSASFERADLRHSSFWKATLTGSSLQTVRMNGTDMEGADLTGVRFHDATTMSANFSGANLRGAQGLTQTQLAQARTDRHTILPDGSSGPFLLGSGAHRPCR